MCVHACVSLCMYADVIVGVAFLVHCREMAKSGKEVTKMLKDHAATLREMERWVVPCTVHLTHKVT